MSVFLASGVLAGAMLIIHAPWDWASSAASISSGVSPEREMKKAMSCSPSREAHRRIM